MNPIYYHNVEPQALLMLSYVFSWNHILILENLPHTVLTLFWKCTYHECLEDSKINFSSLVASSLLLPGFPIHELFNRVKTIFWRFHELFLSVLQTSIFSFDTIRFIITSRLIKPFFSLHWICTNHHKLFIRNFSIILDLLH